MNKSLKRNLLLEASSLALDDTRYDVSCPSCGQSSFALTRNSAGILYLCFRDKCGIRGFVPSSPTEIFEPVKHKVKEYKVIETTSLDNTAIEFFETRFGIMADTLAQHGVVWSPEYNRVVFPIRDWLGREIGRTLRGYKEIHNYQGNKTLHFKYSDSIPFAFYTDAVDMASSVVIVEDPVSAIKIKSLGYPCIALLGTSFSSDLVKLLKGKRIYLWLDADALATSAKYRMQYRMFFESIIIISSSKDPKDLPNEEIHERLNGTQNT